MNLPVAQPSRPRSVAGMHPEYLPEYYQRLSDEAAAALIPAVRALAHHQEWSPEVRAGPMSVRLDRRR